MQTTIQYLTVNTDYQVLPAQMTAFRGKSIEQAVATLGADFPDIHLFHNHLGEKDYDFGYPLIQYRTRQNKGRIVAFNEAIPLVKRWLMLAGSDSGINLNHVRFEEGKGQLNIAGSSIHYRLFDWNALSNDNYHAWRKADRMHERLDILERALTGHLRGVASAFMPDVDVDKIHGEIVLLRKVRKEIVFGKPNIICNIVFRTCLDLPDTLALGRTVSIGYGSQQRTRWQPRPEEAAATIMEMPVPLESVLD